MAGNIVKVNGAVVKHPDTGKAIEPREAGVTVEAEKTERRKKRYITDCDSDKAVIAYIEARKGDVNKMLECQDSIMADALDMPLATIYASIRFHEGAGRIKRIGTGRTVLFVLV